ncbi:sentrin-specific protease 6-like isoform X1 [Astyanax mexicanus]|uniref:Sentrin-specific protease 6-like isoform X1 n=1 Tax=Astyanax mexicanus TaxID=7994 RepID=A0A8T2LF10_ASTMX|nr:sentrin-specific protease 6-like isoform X1 [Astyanax mexicanus]
MTQSRKQRDSLALDFDEDFGLPPPKGVLLQRRRFYHALGGGSPEETRHPLSHPEIIEIDKDGPVVNCGRVNSKERMYCTDTQPVNKLSRKSRMRDQFGEIVPIKCKTKSKPSITKFPSLTWDDLEEFNRVTLNIRSLRLGTLNMNFRGTVTFSVDSIEIPNKAQIVASGLISCEWCTEHKLPALFLQTTAAEWLRLGDLTIGQNEKYIVLIFESEPTLLEKALLEQIFAEIGRRNNISNISACLAFDEANDRLMANRQPQKEKDYLLLDEVDKVPLTLFSSEVTTSNRNQEKGEISRYFSTSTQSEITTFDLSDSEDHNEDNNNDDLMVYPSSKTARLIVYPPPPAKGGFSITEEDLRCLDEGEFLNDVIVDFYLKYLVCEKLETKDTTRCHVVSSFFYKSLTQEGHQDTPGLSVQEKRHNRVKTWTRHLDLFEKDFIFVPINQLSHWYLAVICFPGQASPCSTMDSSGNEESMEYTPSPSHPNPMSLFYRQPASEHLSRRSVSIGEMDEGFCFVSDHDSDDDIQYNGTSRNVFNIASKQPCILIMDSLSCRSKPTVVKILQEYLEMEWLVKKGTRRSFANGSMNGWSLQVPQQDNHTDCGVYLLQYAESLIMNPPQILHPGVDLSEWFPQTLVKKKREKIKRLINRLHRQQQLDSGE